MRQFITIIIILAAFAFQPNVNANQTVNITGRLLDESQNPLSDKCSYMRPCSHHCLVRIT